MFRRRGKQCRWRPLRPRRGCAAYQMDNRDSLDSLLLNIVKTGRPDTAVVVLLIYGRLMPEKELLLEGSG